MTRPDEEAAGSKLEAAGPPSGGPAARLADVCARRAAVYEVLTYGFNEPTVGLVEALADGQMTAMLKEAAAWLGADADVYAAALDSLSGAAASIATQGAAAALGDVQVEHARLFTGPGRTAVKCYASEYLDADQSGKARLNGPAALFAAAAYEAEGATPVGSRGELPDHATVELEFLYHLCRREEQAWAAGDQSEALRLRRTLDTFLRTHAGAWLPAFAEEVRTSTRLAFYSGMAELLSAHLTVELGEAGHSWIA